MEWLLDSANAFADLFPFLKQGFFAQKIFGSMLGEYLLCIASIVFFTVVGKITVFFFRKYMHGLAKKTKNEFDDMVMETLSKPMFWFFPFIGLYVGLHFLELKPEYFAFVDAAIFTALTLLFAWVFIRLVDGLISFFLTPLAAKTHSDLDDQLIPVLRNALKTGIMIMLLLIILSYYGVDILPALAGLGVGGLAIAFAAKETIADIFGGVSIFTSKPFTVGDLVEVGDIRGRVKQVGLRHTRIKAIDKRLITMPNSKVANSVIENISKAPARMTDVTIGLTYETTVKEMGKAMKILKKIINKRDDCEKDPMIVFKEFSDSSVNVMVRYWISDKKNFRKIRSEVNSEIKKRFDKAGLNFAFPTQTIQLEK